MDSRTPRLFGIIERWSIMGTRLKDIIFDKNDDLLYEELLTKKRRKTNGW